MSSVTAIGRNLAIGLIALILGASAAWAFARSAVDDLSGRYGRHFLNPMATEPSIAVDDVVEILPVDRNRAYFRMRFHFFNGHTCSAFGVAQAAGNGLVYRAPPNNWSEERCTLRIARRGNELMINDEGTCRNYCGVNGSLSNRSVPWNSKRRISYAERIRSSWQYRDALTEMRTGRSVR